MAVGLSVCPLSLSAGASRRHDDCGLRLLKRETSQEGGMTHLEMDLLSIRMPSSPTPRRCPELPGARQTWVSSLLSLAPSLSAIKEKHMTSSERDHIENGFREWKRHFTRHWGKKKTLLNSSIEFGSIIPVFHLCIKPCQDMYMHHTHEDVAQW